MIDEKERIQIDLNRTAFVIKKYNIGNEKYFFDKFKELDNSQLQIAWDSAEKKIQNKDIVKDSSNLTNEEIDKVNLRLKDFAFIYYRLFKFLEEDFEEKKLKLSEERIERRVKRTIAERYIELITEEIILSDQKRRYPFKFYSNFLRKNPKRFLMGLFYIVIIIGLFSFNRIKDGFTSVNILTERIHEESKYQFRVGAICRDGWESKATGKGACSNHGGVLEWVYKTDFNKSIKECKEEASKISWMD